MLILGGLWHSAILLCKIGACTTNLGLEFEHIRVSLHSKSAPIRRSLQRSFLMNISRLQEFAPLVLSAVLLVCCTPKAQAFQVYKWIDEKGRVHFGDQTNAPLNSKKVEIKVREPLKPQEIPDRQASSPVSSPSTPMRSPEPIPTTSLSPLTKKPSKPVDPTKVPAACKGLIDQIAKVESGSSWQGLAKSYNAACPGIAYECNNYKRTPEKNHCLWIERSDATILNTNNYQ